MEGDTDIHEAEQGSNITVKTIVVPIDFSSFSSNALRYAVAFAEEFGARLVLTTVVEPPMPASDLDYISSSIGDWYEQARNQVADRLAAFAAQNIHSNLDHVCIARIGEPTKEILAQATDEHADMIIMGTHGRTGVKHMFLGSVAEKTVRHASCPVMVVSPAQREIVCDTALGPRLEILEIIAPLDFSDGASQALKWAEALAEKTGARLNLLHVVGIQYAVGEYDALGYPQLEAELIEAAKQRLATVAKGEHAHRMEVQTAVVRGSARNDILKFAEQQKGDVIVMGTRGLTGIKHLLLGSTAEYVVRHASCAVLTVPQPKTDRTQKKLTQSHAATA